MGAGMSVLRGMRVCEVSAFVAVPLAGMTLAQMGAEVIRIDRPGGGLDAKRWPVTARGDSLFWAGLNKGKRSVCIDYATPEGAEIAAALVTAPGADAGLFLTNLGGRGWMEYGRLARARADMVMVSLLGTRRGEPAVDYTVNAAVGFPMVTGPEGSDPVAHVLPAWDCIAGQMVTGALLAAERHRLRTGVGQLAELSLKDVAAAMLGNLGIIGEVVVNGVDRGKAGNFTYGAYGQDFVLADGARVMVIGLTDRQWAGLVKVTGTAEAMARVGAEVGLDLSQEGARWVARKAITGVLAPWFAARTLAEVGPMFDKAGLTWAPFRTFAQAVHEDPDLSPDNPVFAMVEQPGIGTYPVPGHPVAFGSVERVAPGPAPALGADTEGVLAEVLGMGSGQIGVLMDRGVVAG